MACDEPSPAAVTSQVPAALLSCAAPSPAYSPRRVADDSPPRLQIWWLDPELTYGSAKPFVFTQGHSVCNRSFFPCFDTPAVKCTYSAVVKVRPHLCLPQGLRREGPRPLAWLVRRELACLLLTDATGPVSERKPTSALCRGTALQGGWPSLVRAS